jgi:alkylation response protein AidB-like acyl-CoA dehydrogenase
MASTPAAVRAAVREWLEETWSVDDTLAEWRRRLADSGWCVPSWPVEYWGRGLPSWANDIVGEELARAGAVGPPLGAGITLAGPTLLAHGSEHLKQRLLPPILVGEESWCQLFSEPGAGSDLASLSTAAVRDGDEWVVNGQKLWTTSAHHADFGLLIARTDWDVPKHRGLTYFVLPMHQDGVEVRPLRQMNGHASFNEIFLSDARVPNTNVVAAPGDGWKVALTTLEYERAAARLGGPSVALGADSKAAREADKQEQDYRNTYSWYPQRAGRADLVAEFARAQGKGDDPLVRDRIASVVSLARVNEWTAQRARAAVAAGRNPGAAGSLGKLAASNLARAAAEVHSHVAGAAGMLGVEDGPIDGTIAEILLSVPAKSIAGGTDEIQKNILGERILGLPREPSVDADVPFRDVLRSGNTRGSR